MICAFLLFLFTFAEIRVFSYINTVRQGTPVRLADLHAGLDEWAGLAGRTLDLCEFDSLLVSHRRESLWRSHQPF